VNTEIRISSGGFELQLWQERNRWPDLNVNDVDLRWIRTDECERDRVLSRIAAPQVNRSVVRVRWFGVMLVSGGPVVMLRMIVIVIGVGMEPRHHAGRRNQRRNEQHCEGAMHNEESI
jgi:hypothetical protein